MMKRFLFLLALMLIPTELYGQGGPLTPAQTSTGNITILGATCLVTNACVVIHLPNTTNNVAVTVTGTFTGTLQFEQSADNQITWVAASPASTTTIGVTTFGASALTDFRVRASAFASGTAGIFMNVGLLAVNTTTTVQTVAGGGVTAINVTAPPFNAKNDARYLQGSANGCFGTNGSPVVNCNAAFFKTDGTDVGRNFMMFQNNVGVGGATYFQSTTVCSVQSTTQATMCNNNTGSTLTTGFANLVTQIIGTDARAAIRAAQAAMTNTFNQVYFPCGVYYVTDSFINGSEVTGVTAGPFGWVGESGGSDGGSCVTFIWPQDSSYTLLCANSALLACINAPGPGGPAYVENLTFDALGMVNASTNPVAKITSARGHTTNLTFRGMNYNSAGTYTYVHSADDTTEYNLSIQPGAISASGIFHQSARTTYINPHISATGTGSVGFNNAEWNAHIFGGQISAGGTGAVAFFGSASTLGTAVSQNSRIYGTCLVGGSGASAFAVDETEASSGIPTLDLYSVSLNACQTSGTVGTGSGIRIGTATNIVRCSGCWFSVQAANNGLTTVAGSHFFDLGGNTYAGTNSIATGTIHGAESITGVPQTTANIGLTSGWATSTVGAIGSCATAGATCGNTRWERFTITAAGAPGAGPVVTVTFPTLIGSTNTGTSALAGFLIAPMCSIQQVGGTFGVLTNPAVVNTATTATITFAGTPVAAQTYTYILACDLP